MTQLETLKNSLIDRLLLTDNEILLRTIENIFELSQQNETLKLTSQQVEMLVMSDNDIKNGDIISEYELEKMVELYGVPTKSK